MKNWLTGLAILLCCGSSFAGKKPLAEVYAGRFVVGAAVSDRYVLNPGADASRKALKCLKQEFGCVTSENLMKPSSLRPAPDRFDFERSDEFVRLARRLDLDVVGHVLVWHSQTPDWFFQDDDGGPISREDLIERMEEHIEKVVKRYKGKVKYWDVVNEAVDVRQVVDEDHPVNEDGATNYVSEAFFRESKWQQIIGDDYIELAFRFAHEADPRAVLIYNDFGMTDPVKVAFVVKHIIRPLKKKGIHIDAVGMQGHWHLDSPSLERIEESIETLAAAKVKVHITELDISVLPMAFGYTGADINTRFELQDELNPYRAGLPAEIAQQQAERYRALFDLFKSHYRDVERVTLWGISDRDSWKNNFPMRGRTDYPLLFDRNYEPKPALEVLLK